MTTAARHLGVSVAAPADVVIAFAGDPANLPLWAAGLADGSVERVDGRWEADSPMGRVGVEFAEPNPFGVLDHTVTLPSGERVLNPLRVLADGDRCDVVLTVRRRAGMTAEQFEQDCRAVAADLETLRSLVERG